MVLQLHRMLRSLSWLNFCPLDACFLHNFCAVLCPWNVKYHFENVAGPLVEVNIWHLAIEARPRRSNRYGFFGLFRFAYVQNSLQLTCLCPRKRGRKWEVEKLCRGPKAFVGLNSDQQWWYRNQKFHYWDCIQRFHCLGSPEGTIKVVDWVKIACGLKWLGILQLAPIIEPIAILKIIELVRCALSKACARKSGCSVKRALGQTGAR